MASEKLRLLLIDDDPQDRRLIRLALESVFPGIEFVEAGDPDSFEKSLDGSFDLALIESQMFWIDGLGIFRAIRKRHPHLPVIMVTGTGNEEICARAMRAGVADYVVKKPSGFARLPRSVSHVLHRARVRRRRQAARAH